MSAPEVEFVDAHERASPAELGEYEPLIPCRGRCQAWTRHRFGSRDEFGVTYVCGTCGQTRKYG